MNIQKFKVALNFASFLALSLALDILSPILNRNKFLLEGASNFFVNPQFESILDNKETLNEVSEICLNDIKELFDPDNIQQAAHFFDSWSNWPTGLLYGQETSFGNLEQCESATIFSASHNKSIQGAYTMLRAWGILRDKKDFGHVLNFGICLPSTCNSSEVRLIFQYNFDNGQKLASFFGKKFDISTKSNLQLEFSVTSSKFRVPDSIKRAASLGTFVFTLLLILVCLSTLYEVLIPKLKVEPNKLLKAFSVISNLKLLFRFDEKRNDSSSYIQCVDGIRSLNLIWNIFGHAYMWSYTREENNCFDRVEWLKTPFARVLTSANANVDTFLMLTGLLITWICLHKLEKNGGTINKCLMYFHRFLRLTPAFAATVLFAAGIYPLLSSGPVWNESVFGFARTCQRNWWKALLYISNYVSPENLCIGHSWYLATIMQLNILSPFIIDGLLKWPKQTLSLLVVMILLSCYWSFSNMMSLDTPGFAFDGMILGKDLHVPVIYSTHMRMGPWIIGVILAFYMFQQKKLGKKLNWFQVLFCWTVSLTLILAVIFGPQHLARIGKEASPFEAALFESIGRSSWAIGVAWIIFACHMGYAETINTFLSHPFWQPVARLNYSTYLVKTFIDLTDLALQNTALHFSNYEMIALFWSNFGISTTFALILTLMVELPFLTIENYFFSRKRTYKLII